MKKIGDFSLHRFSDVEFEFITIEIQHKNTPIAQLSIDEGVDDVKISIPTKFSDFEPHTYRLVDFLSILNHAKKLLIEEYFHYINSKNFE